MEGQTVATMNAEAGKPTPVPVKESEREQLEVTVTFVVPLRSEDDINEVKDRLLHQLPGDLLTGGTSFGMRRQAWFFVSLCHRIGRRVQVKYDYRRPGSPRR